MERTFIVTLIADTDYDLPFIEEDIRQEMGCTICAFDVVSVEEVEEMP